MQLIWLDWLVIALYFLLNIGIGLYYYRKASGSVGDFFISGRQVPWWLAGTSMVATTFGADTPLVVTGIVYRYGIAGNWLWWALALSGMMTVFFFARLWRRSGVLTDMEFAELRYAGKPAAFLRGFRALYLALPVNTIIMGWVNLAMAKVLELTLGVTKLNAVMFCLGMTLLYATISGLWAVLWTDLVQFVLKMSMVVALAYFSVKAIDWKTQMVVYVGNVFQRNPRFSKIEITRLDVHEKGVTVFWKSEEGIRQATPYASDTVLIPRVDGEFTFKQEENKKADGDKDAAPSNEKIIPVIPKTPVK